MFGLSSLTWKIGGAAIAAIAFLILFIAWQNSSATVDTLQSQLKDASEQQEASNRRISALEQAGIERLLDTQAVADTSKELNDALDKVPVAEANKAPSAATTALGCIRLRQAGVTSSAAYKSICGGR